MQLGKKRASGYVEDDLAAPADAELPRAEPGRAEAAPPPQEAPDPEPAAAG
ncbi:MAG: hypothetical protein LBI49_21810 [Nocardiopsaceae bacterium]|jgi:hypothetical protein|nr:hypothetical protein [Nocardiopsaceae bacterium]